MSAGKAAAAAAAAAGAPRPPSREAPTRWMIDLNLRAALALGDRRGRGAEGTSSAFRFILNPASPRTGISGVLHGKRLTRANAGPPGPAWGLLVVPAPRWEPVPGGSTALGLRVLCSLLPLTELFLRHGNPRVLSREVDALIDARGPRWASWSPE